MEDDNQFDWSEAIGFPAVLTHYHHDQIRGDGAFVDTALQEVSTGIPEGLGLPTWIEFSAGWNFGPRVRIWLTPENQELLLKVIDAAQRLATPTQGPPPPVPATSPIGTLQ